MNAALPAIFPQFVPFAAFTAATIPCCCYFAKQANNPFRGLPPRLFLAALPEVLPLGRLRALAQTGVVVAAGHPVLPEHGPGLLRVLAESEVIVNAEAAGHALHVEVVRADEGECPALLLEAADEDADHAEGKLAAAVLLPIGNDGDEHMAALIPLAVDLRDAHPDGVVERRAAVRFILAVPHPAALRGRHIVVDEPLPEAVEGDEADALLDVGALLLHLADGEDGVVKAVEGLLADVVHAAAHVDDNQIVNCLAHNSDDF